MARKRIPPHLQEWIDARRRHGLSHAQVQMARALGMNPKKLGKLDNDRQEPWKAPLPTFIQELYVKRFGREVPADVLSIEQQVQREEAKKAERRRAKARKKEELP